MMGRLPSLTHFAYWSHNEHCPVLGQVQRALASHRETLEVLSLSFSKHINDSGFPFTYPWDGDHRWEPPRRHDYVLDSFADITRLRGLTLDDHMIWRDADGYPASSYIDTRVARDLVDFFPPHLEFLFVYNSVGTTLPIDSLAVAISDGIRYNLRNVIWKEFKFDQFCMIDQGHTSAHGRPRMGVQKRVLDADMSEFIGSQLYAPFETWEDVEGHPAVTSYKA